MRGATPSSALHALELGHKIAQIGALVLLGNAPASADVKPERKRRGKAKASSEVVELSDDDAPPKLPKVEPPPSNTADAPIDLT